MKNLLLVFALILLISCEKENVIEEESGTYKILLGVIQDYNHEFIDGVEYRLVQYIDATEKIIEEGFIDTLTIFELNNDIEYNFFFCKEGYKPTNLRKRNACCEFIIYAEMKLDLDSLYYGTCFEN